MKLTAPFQLIDRDALYERAVKAFGDSFQPSMIGVRGLDSVIECKAVSDSGPGGYELDGMASTGCLDQDEEIVLPEGLDWSLVEKQYKAVYADHTYGIPNVVGTIRWVKRRRMSGTDGWHVRVRMNPDHYSPQAKQARMLAEAGGAAFSVGFGATDRGPLTTAEKAMYPKARTIVRKATVFELSVTAMPCNLSCGASLLSVDESKAAAVAELVTKGLAPEWASKRFVRPARRVVVCRV